MLLIEIINRCGRKFKDAQAVLKVAGKSRKRLLHNAFKLANVIELYGYSALL
jgi:hypothetical protein